ncbi:Putative zinc- or iron-chelating domain protein [uncultured archaeon]|nr:Putative zinc- or iron-chelating domain protein [uncultured archaeon]
MNKSAIIINVIITLIVYYVFYFREFILARKEFKCARCGKCCSLRVKVNKEDIERIKKAGYEDFLDKKNKNLKRINGRCRFLTLKNGVTGCEIQDIKPKICKTFPISKGLFGKKIDIRCKNCSGKLF